MNITPFRLAVIASLLARTSDEPASELVKRAHRLLEEASKVAQEAAWSGDPISDILQGGPRVPLSQIISEGSIPHSRANASIKNERSLLRIIDDFYRELKASVQTDPRHVEQLQMELAEIKQTKTMPERTVKKLIDFQTRRKLRV